MQTAKEKKPLAHPFANENAVDRARTGKCVRWSGRWTSERKFSCRR